MFKLYLDLVHQKLILYYFPRSGHTFVLLRIAQLLFILSLIFVFILASSLASVSNTYTVWTGSLFQSIIFQTNQIWCCISIVITVAFLSSSEWLSFLVLVLFSLSIYLSCISLSKSHMGLFSSSFHNSPLHQWFIQNMKVEKNIYLPSLAGNLSIWIMFMKQLHLVHPLYSVCFYQELPC